MSAGRRRVLILGGSRGIGAATACHLAQQGCDLALVHRSAELPAPLGEALHDAGARVLSIRADLAEADAPAQAVSEAITGLGGLDAVVLAAAAPLHLALFHKQTPADFERQWRLAVPAAMAALQAAFPALCQGDDPAVVFVLSSVTVANPPSQYSAYTSAKYAALGLMRSLATEWATRRIRVNAVSPSFTATDFVQHLPAQLGAMIAEQTPLKRLATPDDSAAAIAFLASPQAAFVTGVNLPVAGGTVTV